MKKKIINLCEAGLAYIFYGIFRLLPVRVGSSMGYSLGKALIPIFIKKRAVVAVANIQLAFPEKSLAEAREIFAKSCGYFAASVFEIPRITDLESRITFVDEHNTFETMKNSTSLVFSAHYGCWEIFSSRFVSIADSSYSIYKSPKNPYLAKFFAKIRDNDAGMKMITLNKQRLVSLNNEIKNKNININMLVDQKVKEGIAVDFFGRPALTSTFLPLFALKHNLPLIPVRVVRRKDFKFDIILEKPINIEKTGDKEKDIESLTQLMNKKIEEWVRDDPSQWFWLHKRW
ncbi:MAG: lysophospholipid acyltransferase family protein [Alphaproteobacteria bacterium]|jgi:KDO2-lipid IV(A) lauroyltransferase|nr:lysophospholipid acyltransferase family protein [Alphaproteobacteria bacterium]